MLELRGLQHLVKNDRIREILYRHYHRMIQGIIGYLGALAHEVGEDQLPWASPHTDKIRADLTPVYVVEVEKQKELIQSVCTKLYAKETEKTTAEESYVLARALSFGIYHEERVMRELITRKDKEGLARWLSSYEIQDTAEREAVLSYAQALGKDALDHYRHYLGQIGGDFAEAIRSHWKDAPLLVEYENPNTALLFLFSKDELALLSSVQPEAGKQTTNEGEKH